MLLNKFYESTYLRGLKSLTEAFSHKNFFLSVHITIYKYFKVEISI